ncbi:MAG: tRNA (guanine(10)-N(2))-dimethyltransferase [Candidatus Micrarchaeota archaeon]
MQKTKFIQIKEGNAKLLVPEGAYKDPFHLPVFYNPAMEFNRSVSSVALRCCLDFLEDSVIVDGMCALGARGIRYAKENRVKKVIFVDANPDAIKVLRKNVKLNKLKNSVIVGDDLNKFFVNSKDHFDFIEIDPFGTPVFYLQNAIRRLRKKAILSITGTDLANLAGGRNDPTLKHYAARPLRCEYSHEVALRILVGKIAADLVQQDFGATPIISFYKGHSIKAIVFCEKNAEKADSTLRNIGFISHCNKCLFRKTGKRPFEKCDNCGNQLDYAGPLWIGKLQEERVIKEMINANLEMALEDTAEVGKMLQLLLSENEIPVPFYDIHFLGKKTKTIAAKTEDVVSLLKRKGFAASKTHFCPTGFRTDAKMREIRKLLG